MLHQGNQTSLQKLTAWIQMVVKLELKLEDLGHSNSSPCILNMHTGAGLAEWALICEFTI